MSAWSPLTIMAVVDPLDYGAIGDGKTDDQKAITSAIEALPSKGGIVYLAPGKTFRKTDKLIISKAHVKLWSPNRQAAIFGEVGGQKRHQSIICQKTTGCGFFGLLMRSDAAERFDALEDNQISIDHSSMAEVVGCELDNSAATGVFLYGSTEHYIEGNYIHHTWADHIHHTSGARDSWCWDNFIYNGSPNNGDDGIACVTYGPDSPLCGNMEWWNNAILHTGWGRGYSVVGGDHIEIHHNWAIETAGAGIMVASETSFKTASSHDITIHDNWLLRCANETKIGHPGILVVGGYEEAEPLRDIHLTNNVVVDTAHGRQPYGASGRITEGTVTNNGLSTSVTDLPQPVPTESQIVLRDTSVLKTRDVSFVDSDLQRGLYRIHVRRAPGGAGFEQRFEYVLQGAPDVVHAFVVEQLAAGSECRAEREVGGVGYALLLIPAPIAIPASATGVSFVELRAGDRDGSLSWLWDQLNKGGD